MEDCCVVCAEPLQWIGYGACGHRDVCSTCIARLRFVLNDKHCCICKQECPVVYMTKALGNFTAVIKDFDTLNSRREIWYDDGTESYFDDKGHFEMIKAMCRLSCQVCEKLEGAINSELHLKKGYVFKSIDQLWKHLQSSHQVQMCALCLEGRKIFISEQKLYAQKQLDRHLRNGDPEVDGIGEERGGFAGHPMCEFCQTRFYSDNEIYHHMSVDHYHCHLCQRLQPGHYEYFRNYDDLEAHFRHEHSLCEHPLCLAKKFVVFTSDTELKRHNAMSHGGNMSRSQRNAVLQIPVSFQFCRPSNPRSLVQRAVHSDFMSGPLGPSVGSMERSSNETLNNVVELPNTDNGVTSVVESSRYLSVVGGGGTPCLEESAFPPLPGSKNARRKSKHKARGSAGSTSISVAGYQTSDTASDNRMHSKPEGESSSHVKSSNQWLQAPIRKRPEGSVTVVHSASNVNGLNLRPTHVTAGSSSGGDLSIDAGASVKDEVRIANKALIESMRTRLGNNESLFTVFKDISAQFRKGTINANIYYNYTVDFGLSDLIPEIARLCPDSDKQKDLLEAFEKGQKGKQVLNEDLHKRTTSPSTQDSYSQMSQESALNGVSSLRLTDRGGTTANENTGDSKGKQKTESSSKEECKFRNANAKTMKNLMSNTRPEDMPAVTHIATSSGAGKVWNCNLCTLENSYRSSHCAACGSELSNCVIKSNYSQLGSSTGSADQQGQGKRKKKSSKFEHSRVGHSSSAMADFGVTPSYTEPPIQRSAGRGAWKNGGGQRLLAMVERESVIESAWRR